MQEVEMGIKRLGAGKAKDLDELQVEYLKWGLKILSPHITIFFQPHHTARVPHRLDN
jgi:hypothetical protein